MTVEYELTNGFVTVFDDADADLIATGKPWHGVMCNGLRYARHGYRDQFGLHHVISMHNLILGRRWVDHINGDGLDNRRCNLRPATQQQNAANTARPSHNTSGYKGVNLYRRTGRYRAYIGQGNFKARHLGYFATAEEAARAYDAAALAEFGEFARLNFPKETAS